MSDRFVLLGLAGPRSRWFVALGQWANAGSLPVDFVKCVSREQVHARLGAGRLHSALILDGALNEVDRDLIAAAHDAGTAAFVVDVPHRVDGWSELGADAVLRDGFGPEELLDALRAHAALVPSGGDWPHQRHVADHDDAPPRGRLVAVCGPGGTGASTLAVALAQQLASDRGGADGGVLLADLCLRAEQGMLHDAGDVGPGVQELVDVCRTSTPAPGQVRSHTFAVTERGYVLLLGLRQPAAWTALRPRAVATALAALRTAFGTVVVDCDADVEGQAQSGSMDTEERHALTRVAVTAADVVFVVGRPGLKGVYSLARIVNELGAAGVEPARLIPVFNQVNRGGRFRARSAAALTALLTDDVRAGIGSPMFIPDRAVEDALHDRGRVPTALGDPLTAAVRERATVAPRQAVDDPRPRRVRVGELSALPLEAPTP